VRKGKKPIRVTRRVAIAGAPDRPAAEALYLELRRVAERHGIAVTSLRIAPIETSRHPHPPSPPTGGRGARTRAGATVTLSR
jgi:hypothetical protein